MIFISSFSSIDPIFKHPSGGGTIYVGNQTAAENLTLLKVHSHYDQLQYAIICIYGLLYRLFKVY